MYGYRRHHYYLDIAHDHIRFISLFTAFEVIVTMKFWSQNRNTVFVLCTGQLDITIMI